MGIITEKRKKNKGDAEGSLNTLCNNCPVVDTKSKGAPAFL